MFSKLNDLALASYVRLHMGAQDRVVAFSEAGRLERRATGFGAACGALMVIGVGASPTFAATTAGSGCTGSAATSIQSFIGSAADFAIGIGAGGAMLMLAVGALLIIFGHTPQHARRGMTIIKNSVIGLGVLAAGLFVKFIVVQLVLGAAGTHNGTANQCLNSGGNVGL
jgi:hypothetical protein